MTKVRETYRPVPMAADSSYRLTATRVAAFVAKTSGTLTVTDADGTVLFDAIPVTAGLDLPLMAHFNTSMGGTIALAGGASGTLLV